MNDFDVDILCEKQPESIRIFFGTEMWERYGYYVVQTLLALYLATYFHWEDKHIYMLVGSFTALTYVSPLIGGWIADHLIGQKRAVTVGAFVLLVSYAVLAMTNSKHGLIICLAGVALGTGLLKPNIASLLGNAYTEGSSLRERGFILFYMGITTGIILGTLVPIVIERHYGWEYAFASASLVLFLALLTFRWGCRRYHIQDYTPQVLKLSQVYQTGFIMIALWLSAYLILLYPIVADTLFELVVVLTAAYVIYILRREESAQARQTAVIGILCSISVLFWAFYFQMFLSWTLFVSRLALHSLWEIPFPAPYYVAVQSVGMIFFGVFFARKKSSKNKKLRGVATSRSFLFSLIATTIAFGFIMSICYLTAPAQLISPLLILPAYLMLSIAELLLSPVGLSAITWLAARNKVSTMLGVFYVSLGVGGFLSGKIAAISAIQSSDLAIDIVKAQYARAFSIMFCLLCVATLLCFLVHHYIRHLLKANYYSEEMEYLS